MVETTDSEVMSQAEQQQTKQPLQSSAPKMLQSLGRQSSIYSLTLDEFQHTLCGESGKNFGSMNMDEFLNSIWTAEEAQAQKDPNASSSHFPPQEGNNSVGKAMAMKKEPSLPRQGSLAIPEPLCRKTVEEVWSEIHRNHPHDQDHAGNNNGTTQGKVRNPNDDHNSATTQRQPTFGEMTLEDFLVRAGVVREQNYAAPPPPPPAQHIPYGMYQSAPVPMGPNFVARPLMVVSPPAGAVNANVAAANFDASSYAMKRGGTVGGFSPGSGVASYGGRIGGGTGGGGGFGQAAVMGSPVSPVSSDGICGNHHRQHHHHVDGGSSQYIGGSGGGGGGRKRIIDGPVEKVVERRQRRMIKNRESAARSRARKQAYTVELEAELNQLKDENAHLKQALAELERRRKQQYYEDARAKAHMQSSSSRAHKMNEKLRTMRRCLSAPL